MTELPPRSWSSYAIRLAVFFTLTGIVATSSLLLGVYFYYAPTLPAFHTLEDYHPKIGTRVYSSDNQLIGEFAAERRVLVNYDQVPPLLFQAFISAEDKRFWSHGGVDYLGILQAVFDKVRKGGKLRGASTISQQVAKSLLAINESYETATERSLDRKIREAMLALRLEQSLSKKDILYLYSNQIFLGYQAYGVQAAAEHYFRKNVWDMTLAEMATFAGLPQRPSDYSPVSNPEKAHARRKYVLRRMLEDGAISQAQHDQAVNEVLKTYPREELYLAVAPYYTEQVRRDIIERYGERAVLEEGLEIYTAVSLELQADGQSALDHGLRDLDKRQGFRGVFGNVE
ncbi:MAG: transglycosylase domain-containing protein, partial [Clostridia bacterium]|nr:transglycosylase domain-containing protein [Deltaproteobacteria bacterium]